MFCVSKHWSKETKEFCVFIKESATTVTFNKGCIIHVRFQYFIIVADNEFCYVTNLNIYLDGLRKQNVY